MAPRGPLPTRNPRRRNKPTIPTTNLPVSGRQGAAPAVPSWVTLRKSGLAWWKWAWSTPQACAWGDSVGQESFVARRAQLEDMVAALNDVRGLDIDDVELTEDERKNLREMRYAISAVAAIASGHLALMKEMRELDDRLGLTPKGMEALRWKIVADAEPDVGTPPAAAPGVTRIDSRRARLTS
jgi:hypothetical protein